MSEELLLTRDDLRSRASAGVDALAPVATPEVELTLRVASTGSRVRVVDGWASGGRVVLHERAPADVQRPVLAGSWTMLPNVVAATVGLGPRPRATGSFTATVGELSDAIETESAPPWPATDPSSGASLWMLEVRCASTAARVWRLDSGPDGIWRPVERTGDLVRWERSTSTSTWAELTEALGRAAA